MQRINKMKLENEAGEQNKPTEEDAGMDAIFMGLQGIITSLVRPSVHVAFPPRCSETAAERGASQPRLPHN